jgi:hypothetical protein
MNHHSNLRILAIDVRRNRFGYVLFEGPKRLLDWGANAVSPKLDRRAAVEVAQRRVAPLLRRCQPMAAVVKRPRRTKKGQSATPGPMLGVILCEALMLQIPVYFVTRQEILEVFRIFRSHSKDDIAEVLVRIFPELIVRLPPRRGKWGTERPRMVIFDALAAGFTYWQHNGASFPPPE